MTNEKIKEIGAAFRLSGDVAAVDTITNGNINTTLRVTYQQADGSEKSYIFQRINTVVFSIFITPPTAKTTCSMTRMRSGA